MVTTHLHTRKWGKRTRIVIYRRNRTTPRKYWATPASLRRIERLAYNKLSHTDWYKGQITIWWLPSEER